MGSGLREALGREVAGIAEERPPLLRKGGRPVAERSSASGLGKPPAGGPGGIVLSGQPSHLLGREEKKEGA